jgi:hypothetical protein
VEVTFRLLGGSVLYRRNFKLIKQCHIQGYL